MKYFCLLFLSCLYLSISAQQVDEMNKQDLPYYEIPEAPEKYNSCTVTSRMIDGLGFRYYWATEGLTDKDLEFKAAESSRTSAETLKHIYGLSTMILNAVQGKVNKKNADQDWTHEERRQATLNNLLKASNILRVSKPKKMKEMEVIFQRGETQSKYPFWNVINGPIEDAVWHVGQIVSNRRASGNPFNGKASVFTGKLRS